MGQAASFTLNDGTSTPVPVTFSPERLPDGRIAWVDRRKSSRALQPSIILKQSPASGGRPTNKVGYEVVYPIEGLVDNVPAPVATARYVDGTFVIPDIMPAIDRAHLAAFTANFQDATLIKAVFKDLDFIF